MDEKKHKYNALFPEKAPDSEIQTLLKPDNCNIQYGSAIPDVGDDFLTNTDNKNQKLCSKVYKILTSLTVEPFMFTYLFGYVMNMSVLSNMIMDKGCYFYFNYSSEVCTNLSVHKEEKNNVERLSADYSLYCNLLSLVAASLMIFIAPWSDKYGRKFPLIIAIIGAFLTDIGFIFCSIYFDSRLEYLILSRLPSEILGGFVCVLTIVFSLVTEQSSVENRTLKYTFLQLAFGLGLSFGGLAGSYLSRYYGYQYVYMTVAALHAFGFLWILLMVEETRGLDKEMKWYEKAKDFFVCESFKDSLAVTCKPRPGHTRALLLCLLASTCLLVLGYEGVSTIGFLYVHHEFNWDLSTYNLWNTTSSFTSFALTILLVPIFIRVLKINDFIIGIIGTVSMMMKSLLIAFSGRAEYLYYAGLCASVLSALCLLSTRTTISKLVNNDEVGRVFAFLAICEALMPMMSSLIITKVFESTMDVYPSVVYLVTAITCLVPLGTFIWASQSTKISLNTQNVAANDHVRQKD